MTVNPSTQKRPLSSQSTSESSQLVYVTETCFRIETNVSKFREKNFLASLKQQRCDHIDGHYNVDVAMFLTLAKVALLIYRLRLIGPVSYILVNVIKWFTHESTASFSHECILLPSYVFNMHQDTKSTRLIAVCKRTLTVKADFHCCGVFLRISLQTDALCRKSRALSIRKHIHRKKKHSTGNQPITVMLQLRTSDFVAEVPTGKKRNYFLTCRDLC